jgi:hypothetical protein
MTKRPPLPKYVVGKRLRDGTIAFYWAPPTWALRDGCPMAREALGTDYGEAKRRCDVLNPQFQAWLKRGEIGEVSPRIEPGSFDWLAATFKRSPKFTELPVATRNSYDNALRLVADYRLTDGRRFGKLSINSVTPGTADKLFAKLKIKADGTTRTRTAILSMAVARIAWNVARRISPGTVPANNPFEKMRLKYKPTKTRPVTRAELDKLVAAADALGTPSIGTACLLSFYTLLRQTDCLTLTWGAYRPSDAPNIARLAHHKTGEPVDVPLIDDDGSILFPELCTRLDRTTRHGSLVVMRDVPDRRRKVHLPWDEDYFRKMFAKVRRKAGLGTGVTFMGLRHGRLTEASDAGLSDAQMMALSGHRTRAALLRYSQVTPKQRKVGARLLRDGTKQGDLSE